MNTRLLSIAIIVATIIISLLCVVNGPEQIILHWNFSGDADSYGSKSLILILPVISTIIFLLLASKGKHLPDTSLLNENSQRSKHPQAVGAATPILLSVILYITACSACLLPMYSWVSFVLIILAIILFIYNSRRRIKR